MEIKTDALFKKEIKKSIEYALQEFGLKTARKWQTQYKEIKRSLEFMPKRYPIVAHFRNERMEFRGAIIMKNFKIIISLYDKQKNPPGVPTDFESGRTSGGMFVWSCILQRLIHFFPIYQSLACFIEFHCQGDNFAFVCLEWFCVALFLHLILGSRNATIV